MLGKPKNKKLLFSSIIILVSFTGMIVFLITLLFFHRTSLDFQTIEQGESAKVYKSTEPAILVIKNKDEDLDLSGLITSDAEESLKTLDYEDFFAVIVFQGLQPTSGYGVEIEKVTRKGKIVTLYTKFIEPKPDQEKSPEVRSPYHLIQVKKVENWDQEIEFQLVVERQLVAVQTLFIP